MTKCRFCNLTGFYGCRTCRNKFFSTHMRRGSYTVNQKGNCQSCKERTWSRPTESPVKIEQMLQVLSFL